MPGAAFGFDAVEQGVLDNGLEGEAVDQAAVEFFGPDPAVQGDAAAVTVLLDQEIVLHQVQLLF